MFCGSRKIAQGTKVEEVFLDDAAEEHDDSALQDEPSDERAKEILEVPRCVNCAVETELDSLDRNAVARKAIRRVDKADGGLSRLRWERREAPISRSVRGRIQRVPGGILRATGEHTIGDRVHPSRLVLDGAHEETSNNERINCALPLDSTIYVSIIDPIGEPAFKPSLFKPIPQWMQLLPSRRRSQRRTGSRPLSILDNHFRDVTSESAYFTTSRYPQSLLHSTNPEHTPPSLAAPGSGSPHPRPASSQHSEPIELADISITTPHGRKTVTNEPLKRPSSRVANEQGEARGRSSRSPRMRQSSSSLAAATGSVISHLKNMMRRTPPPQSREYLDLYRPMTSEKKHSPSIAVAGRSRYREQRS